MAYRRVLGGACAELALMAGAAQAASIGRTVGNENITLQAPWGGIEVYAGLLSDLSW